MTNLRNNTINLTRKPEEDTKNEKYLYSADMMEMYVYVNSALYLEDYGGRVRVPSNCVVIVDGTNIKDIREFNPFV